MTPVARAHDLHPVKVRSICFTFLEYRAESELHQVFIGYSIFFFYKIL